MSEISAKGVIELSINISIEQSLNLTTFGLQVVSRHLSSFRMLDISCTEAA